MNKKQINNIKFKQKNNETINSILKYHEESSILGNSFYIGFILFGIIIIFSSIIYYFFKISNTFIIGIFAFLTSLIISILYLICQSRNKCKIRMIVDIKNYKNL